MITDMTKGSPSKILWTFSVPMLISVIFQQLYNIVDSVIAGRFIGSGALAAVGASYAITMIFMAVAFGANIGVSVVVSQLFGARDYGRMKTAINTSIVSILVISVVLTGVGLWTSKAMLEKLSTPQDIFSDCMIYLNIYIIGLVFLFLYNICTGVFTALGDSRTPLYFLIASSLGNIVLDLVFVIVFHMGVAGVAWATFAAQGLSSILAMITLIYRLRIVPHEGETQIFSWPMFRRISVVAIPSILQQSFVSVGNLLIQGLVNQCGEIVIAGYSGAFKLNGIAITCFATLSNAQSNFTAQNMGAGQFDRVRHGFRAGVLMVFALVLPCTLLYFLGADWVMRLFVDAGKTEIIAQGCIFLRIVSPFYIVIALKLMADSVLRGAGDMIAFMIATFSDLTLRVVLAFVLSHRFGAIGIWSSWPFGWILAALLSSGFYVSGRWMRKCPQLIATDAKSTED